LDIIKVIILGIVQGLTEFLPVSSSGHLVLAAEFLNFQEKGVAFEVIVHLGTLFSVLIAFRKDVIQMILAPFRILSSQADKTDAYKYLRWDICIIAGTIPAALVGLLFKSQIEEFFSNAILVLVMLTVTGIILLLSKYAPQKNEEITIGRSILIGIAQAFAILPGISRSGSTIVTGLFLNLDRENAAKFSFLLAIPAILGASIIKMNDLLTVETQHLPYSYMLIGLLAAFVSGYLAIFWLLRVVKQGKLEWFALYCFAVVIFSGLLFYFQT
jgi:undecaprenyl-diphosphatase